MYIPGTKDELTSKNLLVLFLLTFSYFVTAKFGLGLAFLHPSATPIWAPTGIAIASFLIWGRKVWPGILIGAFLANLTTAGTVATSTGIAIGNTLEGLVGAYLIQKYIGVEDTFLKPVNIFKYTVLVGILATSISATFGVTSLYLGGFVPPSSYWSVWITWWLGDLGGAIVIAPLILLWKNDHKVSWNIPRVFEITIAEGILILSNLLLFGGIMPQTLLISTSAFISLPIIVWIAYRFSPKETATSIFILFAITILGTLAGVGPFAGQNSNQSLLTIQLFIGTVFLSVMPLAAAVYEQKKLEKSLRGKNNEYEKLIETSPDAILVSDLLGNIKVVNQKTLEMYGLTKRNEIIGKSGFSFVAPEDQEMTKDALSKLIKQGKVENIEYLSIKKSGKKFYSSANASLLYDANGRPEGMIIISHDISKKREIEKLKTEFVSLASHQLRTPLGSMRWTFEMLLNGDYGKVPDFLKNTIEDLYKSLIRLIRLVNDLLDVTKIEEGKIINNPQKVDVALLLEKVILLLTPLAIKNKLQIHLRKEEHIGKIFIDKGKLGDVFENMLSNSIKYNKPNGKIDVHLEKIGGIIKIQFKDTGLGIPTKDKRDIFTKFFRSEKATEQISEGTGLGLYIVKSYIENWGGKIYFESELGKGSTFTLEIPLNPK